MTILTNIKDSN